LAENHLGACLAHHVQVKTDNYECTQTPKFPNARKALLLKKFVADRKDLINQKTSGGVHSD
jgi:hypothetical protein